MTGARFITYTVLIAMSGAGLDGLQKAMAIFTLSTEKKTKSDTGYTRTNTSSLTQTLSTSILKGSGNSKIFR